MGARVSRRRPLEKRRIHAVLERENRANVRYASLSPVAALRPGSTRPRCRKSRDGQHTSQQPSSRPLGLSGPPRRMQPLPAAAAVLRRPATAGATASAWRSTARTATRSTAGRTTRSSRTTTRERARRRAGEARARAARRRREERRHLVAFAVQRSRRRGQGAQAPRGQAAARARLEAQARAVAAAKALPGPLTFSPGTSALALGGRSYRGTFRVTGGKEVRVVNTVGLEPYL